MSSLLDTLSSATTGMMSQGKRIRVVSENVANADTPGYRRKLISFEKTLEAGSSEAAKQTSRVSLDRSELREAFDPAHPMADELGYVTMSNVDLVTEIADAREAQRSYEANLSIFDQARRMYGGVMDLLRR